MKGLKTQIRQGVFETNSSSTHAISIADYGDYVNKDWYTEYNVPEKVHFGLNHEFGWEFASHCDVESKAAYFWITCCNEYCYLDEKHNLDDIKATVTEWLTEAGVKEVTFDMGGYHECSWDKDRMYMHFDGYIDHSDFDFAELLLSNKKILLSYIFNTNSVVNTGNDNDDADVEYTDNAKWTFWKGN